MEDKITSLKCDITSQAHKDSIVLHSSVWGQIMFKEGEQNQYVDHTLVKT